MGTGYWARELHAVGVAGHPDAELAAVWGRDPARPRRWPSPHGARAFAGSEGYDDMLADVDAVVFAVPPDVQAPLALRAAEAGRHLLLEKPVALSAAAADEVAAAAERTGVASVVFFTERFVPEREAWLQERAAAGCLGGSATWLASLRTPTTRSPTPRGARSRAGCGTSGRTRCRSCCRCSARSPRSRALADARTWCTWCCPTRAARPARSRSA